MIKEIRIAHVWYDNDFFTGSGHSDEDALQECWDEMVEQDIFDVGEWEESGYECPADFIRDTEDGTVSTWSLFLSEEKFNEYPEWKGFDEDGI